MQREGFPNIIPRLSTIKSELSKVSSQGELPFCPPVPTLHQLSKIHKTELDAVAILNELFSHYPGEILYHGSSALDQGKKKRTKIPSLQ